MALNLVVPNPVCSLTSSRFPLHKRSQLSLESPSICKTQVSKTLWFYCNCMTRNTSSSSVTKKKTQPGDQTIVRRLASYRPPVWKYDYLQSLTSTYVWQDLIHCYVKEVNWAHSGEIPTMEEYMNHAWTSIVAPMMLTHAYLLSTNPSVNPITQEKLDSLENYHDLIKWPSLIVRLANDLGTSWDEVERGDNPKSIQIYMHETGASAKDARDHVKHLISEAWKKLNEARFVDSHFNRIFVEIATNLARVSQFMYQHGDGHGHGHDVAGKNKKHASLLLIKPIPLHRQI